MEGETGVNPVTNDHAVEWLGDILGGDPAQSVLDIRGALEEGLDPDEDRNAILCCHVQAAAAFVALVREADEDTVELAAIGAEPDFDDSLFELARRALSAVQGEDSELHAYWQSKGQLEEWHQSLAELTAKLH